MFFGRKQIYICMGGCLSVLNFLTYLFVVISVFLNREESFENLRDWYKSVSGYSSCQGYEMK